mmetsp:Transcript_56425/g.126885  ORF Transcript_56425/g.126885 Transcript_56425/m.126885 type:complete len:136 (+) Transcript_56425:625-1032(+)
MTMQIVVVKKRSLLTHSGDPLRTGLPAAQGKLKDKAKEMAPRRPLNHMKICMFCDMCWSRWRFNIAARGKTCAARAKTMSAIEAATSVKFQWKRPNASAATSPRYKKQHDSETLAKVLNATLDATLAGVDRLYQL